VANKSNQSHPCVIFYALIHFNVYNSTNVIFSPNLTHKKAVELCHWLAL